MLRDGYGYEGSVDLVKRRLRELRPPTGRAAQRTGCRPGQVLQLDWLELPTRPKIAGRERRVYALLGALPYSGAQSARFSFDMTAESFLEGHVRIFDWLSGVPRECVYDNLRSVVARRERDEIRWNPRFLHLRGHYACPGGQHGARRRAPDAGGPGLRRHQRHPRIGRRPGRQRPRHRLLRSRRLPLATGLRRRARTGSMGRGSGPVRRRARGTPSAVDKATAHRPQARGHRIWSRPELHPVACGLWPVASSGRTATVREALL
jgi:hypothetical protein